MTDRRHHRRAPRARPTRSRSCGRSPGSWARTSRFATSSPTASRMPARPAWSRRYGRAQRSLVQFVGLRAGRGLEPRHARRRPEPADGLHVNVLPGRDRRSGQRRLRDRPARLHRAGGRVRAHGPQHRDRPGHARQPGPQLHRPAAASPEGQTFSRRPEIGPELPGGAADEAFSARDSAPSHRRDRARSCSPSDRGRRSPGTTRSPTRTGSRAAFTGPLRTCGSARRSASPGWTSARSRHIEEGPQEGTSVVEMEIEEEGRPLRKDAHLQGPPAAVPRGQLLHRRESRHPGRGASSRRAVVPATQTAGPVSVGDFLKIFESNTREDVRSRAGRVRPRARRRRRGRVQPRHALLGEGVRQLRQGQRGRSAGQRKGDLSGYVRNSGRVASA